jgi:hypothetical protein
MERPSFFIQGALLELKNEPEHTALVEEFLDFFLTRSCALRVMEGKLPPEAPNNKWWGRR